MAGRDRASLVTLTELALVPMTELVLVALTELVWQNEVFYTATLMNYS